MYYLRQFFEMLFYPLRAMLTAPRSMGSAARKLVSISLAARISILVAFFLVILAIAGYLTFFVMPGRASVPTWLNLQNGLIIVGLIVAIPIVLYQILKLWLEGDVSRFPDIDYAWKAGLAELANHGLSLDNVPLFVAIGSSGEELERALFQAAQLQLRVTAAPTGKAALHWYANPDGIYLVATEVGSASRLAALAKGSAEQAKARPVVAADESVRADQPAGGGVRGTMIMGGSAEESSTKASLVASQLLPDAPVAKADIRGTMVIAGGAEDGGAAPAADAKPVLLTADEQREQEQRLEYLCRLIARARQPLCPVNGILALLPYSIVQKGRREGVALQGAVKRDLATMARKLRVRAPVISLVTGMESESGFRELVRRVGKERSTAQRFGKGYNVWNPPSPEQLEAVAAHACGLFEDWTYSLFKEKGALGKPGNTKLYGLLCKVRRNVQQSLKNVLAGGFGHEPDSKTDAEIEPMLFGGCYFAATGPNEERQAFVKSVVGRLPEQQEELIWTSPALHDDAWYRSAAQFVVWIDALLLIALVALVVYRLFFYS